MMTPDFERVQQLYKKTLSLCPAATEKFYEFLRSRGIFPTPGEGGDLYAPNPVLVPGTIVTKMVEDLNRFVDFRKSQTHGSGDLLALMPPETRHNFASPEIAEVLWRQLQTEMPLAQLDAFFVSGGTVQYLEWQTVGSYPTLGRWVLQCARSAWPPLQEASITATQSWTASDLDAKLRAFYINGIEDPRTGVIIDYKPLEQVTRREFFAVQELTGGTARGLGIIDPREIRYHDNRPHYQRDGKLLPIRLAYSRLVHGEMAGRLLTECSREELLLIHRFFSDANLRWLSHPLHFYYGSKAHFADFYAAQLSSSIPETTVLTDKMLPDLRQKNQRLLGYVYKPVIGHGGQDVIPDPLPGELKAGGLLQQRIYPEACHPTVAGNRVPEIRLMAIPENGRLAGAALFTRVMHPEEFKSNAGAIAARAWPGTGEGYAFTVW